MWQAKSPDDVFWGIVTPVLDVARNGLSVVEGRRIAMKSLLTAAFVLSIAASAHAQLSPFNAAGITYGHVHLNVKDVEVQKRLWVDHFDGVVVQKEPLTAVRLPNMLVAFLPKEPTGSSEGTEMDHLCLRVRNIEKVKTN